MKKIILLLTLILCIAVGSKELSKLEKKEALKQFIVFQEAIKNRDDKVLASMVDFSGKPRKNLTLQFYFLPNIHLHILEYTL